MARALLSVLLLLGTTTTLSPYLFDTTGGLCFFCFCCGVVDVARWTVCSQSLLCNLSLPERVCLFL
jgi:hypothetical protein